MSRDIVTDGIVETDSPRDIYFWGLIFYFFVEYVRPQSFLPAVGVLRPGLIATGFLILLLLVRPAKGPPPRVLWGMLALIVLLAVDSLFTVNNYWAFRGARDLFILFAGVVLPIVYFLDQPRKMDRFLNWFLAFNGVIALTAVTERGMGAGSFLKDENDLCMALNIALPLAMCKWLEGKGWRARLGYSLLVILYLLGIVSTMSRGGFLGLLAVGGWMLWRSRRKGVLIAALLVLAVVLLLVTPAAYWREMATIEQATAEGDTGATRMYLWELALRMFRDRPLTGWGAYSFRYVAYRYQGAEQYGLADAPLSRTVWGKDVHSIYFTVLPEAGLIGTLLFGWLAWRLFRVHARIRRQAEPPEEEGADPERLADWRRIRTASAGLAGALVAYLATGAFLSAFYYPHFWVLLALGLALERIWRARFGPPPAPEPEEEAP